MAEIPPALVTYLEMWNERDMDRMREKLDQSVAEGCVWADPAQYHEGRDRLARNVTKFRRRFPDAVLSRRSGIDGQNQRYRYEWRIEMDGDVLLDGMDVATLDDDGMIERVDGFFGPFPAHEGSDHG